MSPLQCLRSGDFWMLFAINGICSGAGLTLLNNVGTQVRMPSLQITSPDCCMCQQECRAAGTHVTRAEAALST